MRRSTFSSQFSGKAIGNASRTRPYLAAGISAKISVSLAGESARSDAMLAASGPGLRDSCLAQISSRMIRSSIALAAWILPPRLAASSTSVARERSSSTSLAKSLSDLSAVSRAATCSFGWRAARNSPIRRSWGFWEVSWRTIGSPFFVGIRK